MVKDKWQKINDNKYYWNKRYIIINRIKPRFKVFVEYSDKQKRFVGYFNTIADLKANWSDIE